MLKRQVLNKPGLICPRCAFHVEFTIEGLLYQDKFRCPGCSLDLNLKREDSRESLEALQELHVAVENLEKAKTFKG